ncbi:MAG TPA: Mur ligase domain-containing protein, partial [Candidatus Limnocylindrales bacterium]|nr:Mur ligase domain-containing protein [Candidatus Limnocylindrales bacterium]
MTERASPPLPNGGERRPGLTADDLVAATGGRLVARSDRLVLGAAVDSREVVAGNLFVALPGERVDGHDFVGGAIRAGAAAVLVAREPAAADIAGADVSVVVVEDTLRAFGAIGPGDQPPARASHQVLGRERWPDRAPRRGRELVVGHAAECRTADAHR